MRTKKCKQCDREFEYERRNARFCSDGCRVQFNRNLKYEQQRQVDIDYEMNNQLKVLINRLDNYQKFAVRAGRSEVFQQNMEKLIEDVRGRLG